VVYLAASTLGSAAPIPGGLGAVETALVAGLTATGVRITAAITAVLAFRTATFWLPAPSAGAPFSRYNAPAASDHPDNCRDTTCRQISLAFVVWQRISV